MDIYFQLAIVIGIVILFVLMTSIQEMRVRVYKSNANINRIIKHLGIGEDEEIKTAVLDLIAQGKNVKAIKLYRELTGEGLKEASDYVDSLMKKTEEKL